MAFPEKHPLARRKSVSLRDIAEEPLIVPDRRSRPHSHDLTVKLFEEAGLTPRIAEVADEKQTIVNLVAARLGAAIMPRWTSRMAIPGVRFVPLKGTESAIARRLPLAVAWLRGSRDPTRDAILDVLRLAARRLRKERLSMRIARWSIGAGASPCSWRRVEGPQRVRGRYFI